MKQIRIIEGTKLGAITKRLDVLKGTIKDKEFQEHRTEMLPVAMTIQTGTMLRQISLGNGKGSVMHCSFSTPNVTVKVWLPSTNVDYLK